MSLQVIDKFCNFLSCYNVVKYVAGLCENRLESNTHDITDLDWLSL